MCGKKEFKVAARYVWHHTFPSGRLRRVRDGRQIVEAQQ